MVPGGIHYVFTFQVGSNGGIHDVFTLSRVQWWDPLCICRLPHSSCHNRAAGSTLGLVPLQQAI